MAATAYERVLDKLRDLGHVTENHDSARAKCPAHNGTSSTSLAIRSIDGSVLICCHAGCETVDVLAALKLQMRDLYDERNGAEYVYPDGRRVHRYANKKGFRQSGNTKGQALFHADRIGDADTVYVPEGEKDVLAAESVGAVAVCSAMGAGKAHKFDWSPLAGKHVVVVADCDEPGRKHAHQIVELLADIAASVAVAEAAVGKDLADHIAAGHTLDELVYLPDSAATVQHPSLEAVQPVAGLRRILDAVADEVQSRGLVGEERLAKTLYLVLTSRLLDKQVSAGVKGHSASGKSYTVETVTKFFPDEAYLEFTAMSEHALVYSAEKYTHRTLIVYEVTALREGVEDDMTSYFVRSLLSEGRIKHEVTIRDKETGGFKTEKITKEGPTNLIFTTTKTRVHAENETRILSLATDDSRAQTARVLLELADETNGEGDLQPWKDLQRWLAGAEHRVTIPYGQQLARQVPPAAVRLRRDFGSLLALIRAHAILHQATRERDDTGRIIATLDDYTVVRELVADIIAEGIGATVSATVRETVAAVRRLAGSEGVALRVIADKLDLDKSTVSRRVRVAADGGFLRNLEDKRGKPSRWIIGDPLPETVDLLPDPTQLATVDTTVDQQCCSVAPESGGYREPVVCHFCGDQIPETQPLARANGYCNKGQCIAKGNEQGVRS
jgi:hypothetical protein